MIANNYKFISFLVACMFCFLGSNAYSQAYSWANSAGSTGQDYAYSTAVDANGNVVAGGAFRGTVDFDPSAAVFNLVNSTTVDNGSVTKYDANGAFVWAFKIGGTGGADAAQVYSVATDAAGNVYITGRFRGTVDFNPDAVAVNNLTPNNAAFYDMFVAKYDANGAYIWAFAIGSTQDDSSQGIAVDNNGDVYLVGMFQGNMDFDPSAGTTSITTTGSYDISLSKYTTAGALVFAQKIGGTGSDRGFGIALDSNNDIIITGRSTSTNLDADPSAAVATFVTNGAEDAFIAKYSNLGAYQWATLTGSTGVDEGLNVATDAANNVYAVGRFAVSLDADPSASVVALTSAGGLDGYLIKYNSAGQYQAGFRLGAATGDEIQSVFVDANNVYITGAFSGTVDFDPSVSNTANLNPGNTSNDIFVASYDFSLNYVSAFNVGGASNDVGYDIFVQNSNIHISGGFQGTADFNPYPATNNLISNGTNDMFIAKYTPCNQPTNPTAAASVSLICGSASAILSVTAGSLGSAADWSWYENTCSGTSVGTGATLTVNPTATTTYYVRAEGGCVVPSACAMTTVSVSSSPSVTLSETNITCAGANNGQISSTVSNGTSPYTFVWGSVAQTTANITGLAAGTYTATVTDAQGCSSTASATITEPTALTANLTANNVDCGGNNTGSILNAVAGGTAPYNYMWSNGATTLDLTGIAAGTYSVTVIDLNACTTTSITTITEPTPLTAMISGSNNPTGCGTATGSINVMGMGGAAPYSFNINGNTFTANNNFSNLTAGIYTVGVLDDNGCFSTTSTTLTDPSAIMMSITATNVSCFAGDNGSATAMVTGATGAINYIWSDGQMAMNATGLVADIYSVTATDANNCSAFAAVTITEPTQIMVTTLTTPASSAGIANGTATANASGGVAPYMFAWSDGQTTSNASGLLPAIYTVTITDANGCSTTSQVNVVISIGVGQTAQNSVIAYPNPTANLLYLQNLPHNSQLILLNALGQIVWQNTVINTQMEISLETFSPALYYLQVIENQKVSTIVIRKQ